MIDVMRNPGPPGLWHNMSVVNSFSAQLPLNLERSFSWDGGNWESFGSASPHHSKRRPTFLRQPSHHSPPKKRKMPHSSLSIHHPLFTRNKSCYSPELVEPPRAYVDSMNSTATKTAASGSSLSSLRIDNGSLIPIYASSSMATGGDKYSGIMAYPDWGNIPSFASGIVQSPSVSSSFEFNEMSTDEPCFNSLPFNTADQNFSSFQGAHMQFGEHHMGGFDQTSQWFPWTYEPELSDQSYFPANSIEAQHWPSPCPLPAPSLAPFSGSSYPIVTPSTTPGAQTGVLISEPPTSHDHTLPLPQPHPHPCPHLHSQSANPLPTQPRWQIQNEHSSPTSSTNSIKSSLHYSDTRDALLIQWKRRGLSYKDIKQIGGFKEAESTLRGRFRTLTKAKEQRVRKPKWTETDIHLLVQAVSKFSESGLSVSRCPPKLSWKKVAQHIWAHGGTYQFGNATCKKKWLEIHNLQA